MVTAANQQNKEVGKWEFSGNATGFLITLKLSTGTVQLLTFLTAEAVSVLLTQDV